MLHRMVTQMAKLAKLATRPILSGPPTCSGLKHCNCSFMPRRWMTPDIPWPMTLNVSVAILQVHSLWQKWCDILQVKFVNQDPVSKIGNSRQHIRKYFEIHTVHTYPRFPQETTKTNPQKTCKEMMDRFRTKHNLGGWAIRRSWASIVFYETKVDLIDKTSTLLGFLPHPPPNFGLEMFPLGIYGQIQRFQVHRHETAPVREHPFWLLVFCLSPANCLVVGWDAKGIKRWSLSLSLLVNAGLHSQFCWLDHTWIQVLLLLLRNPNCLEPNHAKLTSFVLGQSPCLNPPILVLAGILIIINFHSPIKSRFPSGSIPSSVFF